MCEPFDMEGLWFDPDSVNQERPHKADPGEEFEQDDHMNTPTEED